MPEKRSTWFSKTGAPADARSPEKDSATPGCRSSQGRSETPSETQYRPRQGRDHSGHVRRKTGRQGVRPASQNVGTGFRNPLVVCKSRQCRGSTTERQMGANPEPVHWCDRANRSMTSPPLSQGSGGFICYNYFMNKNMIIKIIFSLLIILGLGYMGYNQYDLNQKIKEIQTTLKISNDSFTQKISDIETILLAAQEENTTLAEALQSAKEKTESLDKQFRKVNNNVQDLEKITKTDPELLQKYSRIYFLNEHYAPADLTTIPSEYTFNQTKAYKIHDEVWPYLQDLMDDAKKAGMSLQVISAFRSFSEQAVLKGAYTVTYGAGTANQFSADQGYSEHQLGTTVDFTNPTVADTFSGFSKSKEYQWLRENAYKYGFVISYPENNSYYQFEPWHWRFVGTKLAEDLQDDGKFFYDLTQREIDEYIVDLFD